jgi:hypothetical protein
MFNHQNWIQRPHTSYVPPTPDDDDEEDEQ